MAGDESVGVCELGSETGLINLPWGWKRYRKIEILRDPTHAWHSARGACKSLAG